MPHQSWRAVRSSWSSSTYYCSSTFWVQPKLTLINVYSTMIGSFRLWLLYRWPQAKTNTCISMIIGSKCILFSIAYCDCESRWSRELTKMFNLGPPIDFEGHVKRHHAILRARFLRFFQFAFDRRLYLMFGWQAQCCAHKCEGNAVWFCFIFAGRVIKSVKRCRYGVLIYQRYKIRHINPYIVVTHRNCCKKCKRWFIYFLCDMRIT